MKVGMRRATDDDEIRLARLGEEFQLVADLAATAGEVTSDMCLVKLLGDKAGQAFVALGVGDQRDRREKPPMAAAPGTCATKQAWTQPWSRTAKPTAMAKAR